MSRAAKLAELRALRAAGKTRLSTYEIAEEEDLYDTVDDEGYKKVVRGRLDQDDFVVDDNGEGYVDDGREEWDDDQGRYKYAATESEEEEERPKGKAGTHCQQSQSYESQLTRISEEETRGRRRETGEDQQWHQQVLQREDCSKGAKAEGEDREDHQW